MFNALLGWQNSATYGSVISYNAYWVAVICAFLALRYKEKKGHWPLMKAPEGEDVDTEVASLGSSNVETVVVHENKEMHDKKESIQGISTEVRTIEI